jgi:RNA polymerase sigma factor (sigma-70 family)
MNQIELNKDFDQWLVDYQEDLSRIIGKHRYSHHLLDHSEVLSEVNRALMKDKEKLLNKKGINDFSEFKKIAYSYARNYIKWTADGCSSRDKRYANLKVDTHAGSDSEETTYFELICATQAEEDPEFRKLDVSQRYENLKKWIFDYSHFLSERQKVVLEFAMKGSTFDEIGDAIGITHQAISVCVQEINEKISSYIKKGSISKSEETVIRDGMNSVNYLFGPKRAEYRSKFNTSLKKK